MGFSRRGIIYTGELGDYLDGLSSGYTNFAKRYIKLVGEHHDRMEALRSYGKGTLVYNLSKMDLSRVFWDAVWGALAGSLVSTDPRYAAIGRAVGAGLTVIDEATRMDINLGYVFWALCLDHYLVKNTLHQK